MCNVIFEIQSFDHAKKLVYNNVLKFTTSLLITNINHSYSFVYLLEFKRCHQRNNIYSIIRYMICRILIIVVVLHYFDQNDILVRIEERHRRFFCFCCDFKHIITLLIRYSATNHCPAIVLVFLLFVCQNVWILWIGCI